MSVVEMQYVVNRAALPFGYVEKYWLHNTQEQHAENVQKLFGTEREFDKTETILCPGIVKHNAGI